MIVNVCEFGVKGNGIDKDIEVFKKVIEECEKQGGGIIFVLVGIYYIGVIYFKSNMIFYIESGVVLKFLQDEEDYLFVYI